MGESPMYQLQHFILHSLERRELKADLGGIEEFPEVLRER